MGSIVKLGAAIVLILLILLIVALRFVSVSYLTPDYLAREIESAMNCRAEIGELDLRLLKSPSRIELTNVALGPRDEFAAGAVALKDRPAFDHQSIHCGSVVLEVRLLDLVTRRLNVNRLTLQNLNVQTVLFDDGSNSLSALFTPPQTMSRGAGDTALVQTDAPPQASDPDDPLPPPALPEVPPPGERLREAPAIGADPGVAIADKPAAESFHAGEIPVALLAKSVGIDGGTLYATVEKTGATIMLDQIQFALNDVDIHPEDLAQHNQVTVNFSLVIGVDSRPELGRRFAELHLDGKGLVTPFDAESGRLDPDLIASVTLKERSFIDALPTLDSVGSLMKKLEQLGVNLGEIDLKGDLVRPSTVEFEYGDDVVTVLRDMDLPLRQFAIRFNARSWINTNTTEHDVTGEVQASEERTQTAIAEVDEFLKKKAGPLATPEIRDLLLTPVMKDGRLGVAFRSTGSLSDPKVSLATKIGTISDVLNIDTEQVKEFEKQGKQLLDGLKKAFGF